MTTPYRTAHFFAVACFDPDPDPDPGHDPGSCPLRSLRERRPETRTLNCSIGPGFFFFFFCRRCLDARLPSTSSASGLSSGSDHSALPSLV